MRRPLARTRAGQVAQIDRAGAVGYITDQSVSIHRMPPLPHIQAAPHPRQRRKQARPQELLDAALHLFVERGFASTRMEEVAALAGVSKGTLYLYYPSKEELLKAVIRERLSNEIEAGALEVEQHVGTHAELLRDVLASWWLRVYDNPASGVFKLIITEVRSFPEIAEYYFREVVEPGSRLIGGVLQRGIAAGEFRPVNVEATVQTLVLPMVMLCLLKHSLGACAPVTSLVEPGEFMNQHVALVLGGLLAAPAKVAKGKSKR
jgi:AcrR family transcriptional regulator